MMMDEFGKVMFVDLFGERMFWANENVFEEARLGLRNVGKPPISLG